MVASSRGGHAVFQPRVSDMGGGGVYVMCALIIQPSTMTPLLEAYLSGICVFWLQLLSTSRVRRESREKDQRDEANVWLS